MLLVDTSIWVDHLRHGDAQLQDELERGQVGIHPWIIGEIACGHLRQREQVLSLLADLPQLSVATDQEVLHLIESQQLMGRGIGYIDVHLIAACLISNAKLWTRDLRLHRIAVDVGIASDA